MPIQADKKEFHLSASWNRAGNSGKEKFRKKV